MKIINRITKKVICKSEKLSFKQLVEQNKSKLRDAYLSGADLRWADLSRAELLGADLSNADLSGANLRWADLRGDDLSGADLRGAHLWGANLRGADLRDADLEGVIFEKSEEFKSSQENPNIVQGYKKKILELEEQIKSSPENLRLREKIELAIKFIGQVADSHPGTMTATAAKHFLFNYENN